MDLTRFAMKLFIYIHHQYSSSFFIYFMYLYISFFGGSKKSITGSLYKLCVFHENFGLYV